MSTFAMTDNTHDAYPLDWIKTSDSLPEIDEYVLWMTVEGNFFVEALDKDGCLFDMTFVTHWARFTGPNAYPPDWEYACKNEARNCSRFQSEVCRLREVLKGIADLPYWEGVKMIKLAREALGTDER